MTTPTPEAPHRDTRGLASFLAVLRRRRLIMLVVLIAVPAAAVTSSLVKPAEYQGAAQVLLNRQNLANSLTGVPDATLQAATIGAFANYANTQANLVTTPAVARRVLRRVRVPGRTPSELLAETTAVPESSADFIDISVVDRDRRLASRLAVAFADAYTVYRLQLDTDALVKARRGLAARLANARRRSGPHSGETTTLQAKLGQLQELKALQTSNATVVQSREGVTQTQPKPVRALILGIFGGLVLGIAAALIRDALDSRVRSAEEAAGALELPLLAQLPAPPKSLQEAGELVAVADPGSGGAEAVRMLRTGLDFARLTHPARVIMVSSAVESEGKSTTAANLAVMLARSGQRVVVADCDFRRPRLHELFDRPARPGLTEVVLGAASLRDALVPVDVEGDETVASNGNGNGHGPGGTLSLLTTGTLPPDPGEFVNAGGLATVLDEVARHCDALILDTPPLLSVGDARALSARTDALLVVVRLRTVTRTMLRSLGRILRSLPAPALGIVATAADDRDSYGYYYSSGYTYGPPPELEPDRADTPA